MGPEEKVESAFESEEDPELTIEERKNLTKAIDIAREGNGISESLYQRLIESRRTAKLLKHVYYEGLEKNPEFRKYRKRMIDQAFINPPRPNNTH